MNGTVAREELLLLLRPVRIARRADLDVIWGVYTHTAV